MTIEEVDVQPGEPEFMNLDVSSVDFGTFFELHHAEMVRALREAGVNDFDVFRVEGRYDLAPGISLDFSTGWDSWDADAQPDYHAWSVATGFYIGF